MFVYVYFLLCICMYVYGYIFFLCLLFSLFSSLLLIAFFLSFFV